MLGSMAARDRSSNSAGWGPLAALCVVVAGLALSGCASGAGTSAASAAPEVTVPTDDRAAVETAYRSAIEAFEAALVDPSAASGGLEAWWSGPALAAVRSEVNTWAGFGQALRYPDGSQRSLDVLSVSVAGDTATATACFVDDGRVVDVATGDVLNDEVVTVLESAVLRRTAGSWALAERSQLERTEGVQSCAGR